MPSQPLSLLPRSPNAASDSFHGDISLKFFHHRHVWQITKGGRVDEGVALEVFIRGCQLR